jgi:nucleoside phosphorylase
VILVVAAWQPELSALGRGLRVVRGRRLERAVVGVGPVEAALGTARLLGDLRPTALILIGTAGVYRSQSRRLAIGDAVIARRIAFGSVGTARGLAYFPAPMPLTAPSDARLRARLAAATGSRLADVACPPAITRTAAAAAALAGATGAGVENLEAFAVGRAAADRGVPFAAVLGIANQVGPRAHAEWKLNAAAAAAQACAGVRAFLEGRRTRRG